MHHFIAVIPPRPPTAGQDTPIYCRYTPAPASAGARCINLSPLYPRARQRRGKMHQFDRRYTPAPASAGARCINLSPLYPRARRQGGIAPQFVAVIPPRPPAAGQGAPIYHRHAPHHKSRLTAYTIIARKILLQQIKRRRSHAQDRFMEFYRRKIVTVLALHLSAKLLEF